MSGTGRQHSQHHLGSPGAAMAIGVGVALCGLAAGDIARNYHHRNPNGSWTWVESITFPVGIASALAAVTSGVYLAWRAPRDPSGLRFIALGYALAGWLAASFWSSRSGPLVSLLLVLALRVLLFPTVLAWPTGRFDLRWSRRIRLIIGLYVAASIAQATLHTVVLGPDAPWGWTSWPLPQVGSLAIGRMVSALVDLVMVPGLAAAVLVAIWHRRRRLPPEARSLANIGAVAGVIAAAADLWVFAFEGLAHELIYTGSSRTVIGFASVVLDYARFGAVPVLFAVDAQRRARGTADHGGTIVVDLSTAAPAPTGVLAMLRASGDDPSIQILWPHAGSWVDDRGAPIGLDEPERRITVISNRHGPLVAVDRRSGTELSTTQVESLIADVRIVAEANHQRAQATARLAELRALQRATIDAQDLARRRLERDLHDGAQQQLVGLALQARLDSRVHDAGPSNAEARHELAVELREVARQLLLTVEEERPVALAAGLGAALESLAASCPVPVTVTTRGELDQSPASAAHAWYIVCEAITNSLKHADPESIRVEVDAQPSAIRVAVSDDGTGGLQRIPRSLQRRAEVAGADLSIGRPSTQRRGTIIVASIPVVASAQGERAEVSS